MMTSTVVIGAGFGDEGKGLITDFEARRVSAGTVVRFNGGAQAGHTVVDGDKRHVFGHLAAGSFAGARTYLGQKFIFNPILLEKERSSIREGDMSTNVGVHPRARVSTIYDMVLNSIAEVARDGTGRHGSCGMGINETVTRHEAGFELCANDLIHPTQVRNAFIAIEREWVPARLEQLLKDNPRRAEIMDVYGPLLFKPVQQHVNALLDRCSGINIHTRRATRPTVFEGAQGLRLDEFLGDFPHVTRSITGLPYAIISAESMGIKKLRPTYVTRCYTTRHGAGPLPHEGLPFMNGQPPEDKTNVTNEWQGSLRYAPLDVEMLERYINADLERGKAVAQAHGVELDKPTLAITCLDQVGGVVLIKDGWQVERLVRTKEVAEFLANRLSIAVSHVSYGPEAKNVTYLL
jgi:adenylosuccinate synthase